MDMDDAFLRELRGIAGPDAVRTEEPMRLHTTFRIGGPVEIYVTPADQETLIRLVRLCRQYSVPFFLLGRGSNLLVSDEGVRGVAVSTERLCGAEVCGERTHGGDIPAEQTDGGDRSAEEMRGVEVCGERTHGGNIPAEQTDSRDRSAEEMRGGMACGERTHGGNIPAEQTDGGDRSAEEMRGGMACGERTRRAEFSSGADRPGKRPAGGRIRAEAGISLARLARLAQEASLTGLEFASGIPGTLGGAVVMNAGAYGGEMKDLLTEVTVLTPRGEVRTLPAEALSLGYRTSCIPENGYIVLEAELRLAQGRADAIQAAMDELARKRKLRQPLEYPSAGSMFKRPPGYFAGKLIEEAGLRGFSVGGAQVSEKHCGFVINRGQATAEDVLKLCAEVSRIVYEKSGVKLEMEVRCLGPDTGDLSGDRAEVTENETGDRDRHVRGGQDGGPQDAGGHGILLRG